MHCPTTESVQEVAVQYSDGQPPRDGLSDGHDDMSDLPVMTNDERVESESDDGRRAGAGGPATQRNRVSCVCDYLTCRARAGGA